MLPETDDGIQFILSYQVIKDPGHVGGNGGGSRTLFTRVLLIMFVCSYTN